MEENFTKRSEQIPNLNWKQGQFVGVPVKTLRQIKYRLLPNAVNHLYQALSGARLDCGEDLHKQLIEFGGAAKVWMTVLVEYEPINPLTNNIPFEEYLSAAPTRIFRRDGTISAFANLYIDFLRILTDRIRECNAKFIRDKSGLRLVRVLQFTLKITKYAFLDGRGWQPLPEFLTKKQAIINIQTSTSDVSDTRYFISSNALISQKPTAFERLFTTTICFSIVISIPFLTQSHQTMFIFTRIKYF